MKFSIIAAVDKNFGIGKGGKLPWDLSGDLKHFREVTKGCAVIMGRTTWLSLPERFRPLPGRLNVVLAPSGDLTVPPGVVLAGSFEDAFTAIAEKWNGEVFVIGGGMVYTQAIQRPECGRVYLTEIDAVYDCDTYFPALPADFIKINESELQSENRVMYRFVVFERKV
jgi:dihydrofolate reductase